MDTKSKIAIAASASLAVGALTFALPSLAHDSQEPNSYESKIEGGMHGEKPHASDMKKEHSFATLSATVTGIPAGRYRAKRSCKGRQLRDLSPRGRCNRSPNNQTHNWQPRNLR